MSVVSVVSVVVVVVVVVVVEANGRNWGIVYEHPRPRS